MSKICLNLVLVLELFMVLGRVTTILGYSLCEAFALYKSGESTVSASSLAGPSHHEYCMIYSFGFYMMTKGCFSVGQVEVEEF